MRGVQSVHSIRRNNERAMKKYTRAGMWALLTRRYAKYVTSAPVWSLAYSLDITASHSFTRCVGSTFYPWQQGTRVPDLTDGLETCLCRWQTTHCFSLPALVRDHLLSHTTACDVIRPTTQLGKQCWITKGNTVVQNFRLEGFQTGQNFTQVEFFVWTI